MNDLHFEMSAQGYTQTYVDQFDADTTVLTRHNPNTYASIILVARTSFSHPSLTTGSNLDRPLFVPGKVAQVLHQMSMQKKLGGPEYSRNSAYLNGREDFEVLIDSPSQHQFIDRIDYDDLACSSHVHFKHFPPGAIVLLQCSLNEKLLGTLSSIGSKLAGQNLKQATGQLTFDELNIILYRCENEEQSDIKSGCYNLANHGPLVYAGFQGVMNVLERQRLVNNLG